MTEPLIHSHIDDGLPDGHRWQWEQVHCKSCGDLVHAGNNECMETWFEFGDAAACAECVGTLPSVMHDNNWRHVKVCP